MKKRETRLVAAIRRALRREVGGFWFKVHGGPFQKAGIPDILGCVSGIFFGLEVKVPRKGRVSDIQVETIADICEQGGYAEVVTSPEEAVDYVKRSLRKEERVLAKTKASPTKSRRVRINPRRVRIVFQAKTRKDVDRRRSN